MPLRRLMRLASKARLGRLSAVMVVVLLPGMLSTTGLLWLIAQTGREDEKREAQLRLTQTAQFAAEPQTDAIATVCQAMTLIASNPLIGRWMIVSARNARGNWRHSTPSWRPFP